MKIPFRSAFAHAVWLAALAFLGSGCDNHDHAAHSKGGHHHESAHGGVAVELGEHQFHLDFLADPPSGALKAWVMDAHAENFVRVTNAVLQVRISVQGAERSMDLVAQANATTGEKVGDTSQFEGQAEWMKGVERFSAVVPRLELRGQTFTNIGFSYPAAH